MAGYFSKTIQFPSEDDHRRLKVLAAVMNMPVGTMLAALVDAELSQTDKSRINKLKTERPDLWDG